jgi:hypothetical protein
MFEPHGPELADLARGHSNTSHQLQLRADALKLRGFAASAAVYERKAEICDEDATQCEIALQFERLAGLS